MALPPFLAYIIPVIVLVIGEIAFVCIFCRKQRPRLNRFNVVVSCWIIAIAFGIANIFITANRTEVWIIESDGSYSHKYILKRTGEFEDIGHEGFYVINNSNETFYCAKLHYCRYHNPLSLPSSSSEDVILPINPMSTVVIGRGLDGVFINPPTSIKVKQGESTIRYYLLNYEQCEQL